MDNRSKAPLALIEQSVMLLVFALAAALCLRGFLWAEQTARANAARDQAALRAQTAAEVLKHARGDLDQAAAHGGLVDGDVWTIFYDENWQEMTAPVAFQLTAALEESGVDGLGRATVAVSTADGEVLFTIPVGWQEVDGHA